MNARASAAALCCIVLVACRADEASEDAKLQASVTTTSGEKAPGSYTVRHRIHPSLPEFVFTLVGKKDAAGETLAVQRIEIGKASDASAFQVIANVHAEPPLRENQAPIEILDMNFDGYADFRLVQFAAAGPNIPYLNWLFDPARREFAHSPELDEIPSARYDLAKREIESEWRDGPTRYGTNVYVYEQSQPVLVRKEERAYRAPGVYTLTRSQRVGGAWKTVEVREVRERL